MARWAMMAFGASLCLLAVAAVQAGPRLATAVEQAALRPRVGWTRASGRAAVPFQPFAGGKTPAWSMTDPAVAQLQEQLKRLPDDPLSAARYAQLGSLYLQKVRETGDPSFYPKAEAVFEKSLELAPENALAMIGMGSLALARHDFAGALEWGLHALEQAPRSYVAYGIVGDASIELGRYDDAVNALQQMVDLRPDQLSLSRISYARELHGDLPHAIVAMQQAVDAGDIRSEGTAWARVQLANLYFTRGDLENAELQYRAALYFFPDYAHALAGLGRVAAARGDLKGATALYEQALTNVPWPQYAIELGDVYRALGNQAAAQQADDLVRVMAQLQRANGMDVDLEMALFEADHATDVAARAAALQTARAAYERRPESVHAEDVLAWALYRAGRADDALPYARQAMRLGSKDPLLLFHAAAIAYSAGQLSEARDYLEVALAQNPQFSVRYGPAAQRLLRELRGAGA